MKVYSVASLMLLAVLCLSYGLILFSPNITSAQLQTSNYIQADGSVVGTSSIQHSGDLYTFTGNVIGPLTVERDNIVINGAGFTLQGSNGRGIVLAQRQNVTLENTMITLDGGYIIDLTNATNSSIIGNTLVGAPQPNAFTPTPAAPLGPYAINFLYSNNVTVKDNSITGASTALSMEWCNNNSIIGNNITDGLIGIDIEDAQNNLLRNNTITDNKWGFMLETYPSYGYNNNIDTSNVVDGKPIIYWVDVQGRTVPSGAAYVALVDCSNINVKDTNPQGMVLASTTNSKVTNIQITGIGDGITLVNCSNDVITGSVIENQGIELECSSNNVVSGCTIANCSNSGIMFDASNNNEISKNNITGCNYGLSPFQETVSNNNSVSANNFTGNSFAIITPGIFIISNNTFTGNDQAVLCMSDSNTITSNYFTNNNQSVTLQSQSNVLRNNQFTNNRNSLQINGLNFANDVDSSNTLDGKPIIYWVDQHDETVPSGAGFVALVNCTNIKVQNQILTNQANGILLAYTNNSIITDNIMSNNGNGIYFFGSTYNQIIANNVTSNCYGIYIASVQPAIFGAPPIYVPSSNNSFIDNNFVGNNQSVYDAAVSLRASVLYQLSSTPNSINSWDNGSQGNYWSDYTTKYPNATEIDSTGIGNTPYEIDVNNTDHYPLMKLVTVPQSSLNPSPTPSPTAIPTPTPTPLPTPSPTVTPKPTIPEFPSWIILPLLLAVTLLIFVIAERKIAKK